MLFYLQEKKNGNVFRQYSHSDSGLAQRRPDGVDHRLAGWSLQFWRLVSLSQNSKQAISRSDGLFRSNLKLQFGDRKMEYSSS